eukprot:TRINITY_DN29739_c1_g1_i1.p1 TRINITY_DN29739_c1_g1~~TRINITY_DN29739_c1_g1_i1.p1  ORF type:complete len:638 (+),score=95.24 TRINITY_DN29739_c1_g1_i1:103-2016(+)
MADVDLSGFGLERLSFVGKGQFGQVQRVREAETGHIYVAKCVTLGALKNEERALAHQEVYLLESLKSPFIVAYHDSFLLEGQDILVIVMEHCAAGDLRQAIASKKQSNQHFSEGRVLAFLSQIALALQYIHTRRVMHRDLKSSNIFLVGEDNLKLGDFGISRIFEGSKDVANTLLGTPYYMSPEVCSNEPYGHKADIWSFGCIAYELCMLRHAFAHSTLQGLVHRIRNCEYDAIDPIYSDNLRTLIGRTLSTTVSSRPSIHDIVSDPFLAPHVQHQISRSSARSELEDLALRSKVRTIFDELDKNSNGLLEPSELIGTMQALNASWTPDRIDRLLSQMDTNRDGFIQYEEFLTFVFGENGSEGEAFRNAMGLDGAPGPPPDTDVRRRRKEFSQARCSKFSQPQCSQSFELQNGRENDPDAKERQAGGGASLEMPELGPQDMSLILASRICYKCFQQQTTWSCAVTAFDPGIQSSIGSDDLRSLLAAQNFGLSQSEMAVFEAALQKQDGRILLSSLQAKLDEAAASIKMQQFWAWAQRSLGEMPSISVRAALEAQDSQRQGLLTANQFQVALRGLAPHVPPEQFMILMLLTDKSLDGDIQYAQCIERFSIGGTDLAEETFFSCASGDLKILAGVRQAW